MLHAIYGSYVAGIFRTLRFGAGEAMAAPEDRSSIYLAEKGALSQGADRPLCIDYQAMPPPSPA